MQHFALSTAAVAITLALTGATMAQTNTASRDLSGEKVILRAGDAAYTIELYDNPTAADLIAKLPLTITASNYPGYDEKVLRLRDGLSMEDAPPGDNPLIPEVGYYQPGQWIALYYGPIGYWAGKVPLGKIDASVDELAAISEGASVSIERID